MSIGINGNTVLPKKDYSINYSCAFGKDVVLVTSKGSDHTTNLPMNTTKSKFNNINNLKNKLNVIREKIAFQFGLKGNNVSSKEFESSYTLGSDMVFVSGDIPTYKNEFNKINYLKNKLNYIINKIKFKLKLDLRRKKPQKKDIQHLVPNESKLGEGAEKVYTASQVMPEYNNMMDQNINLKNMRIKKDDIIGQGSQGKVRSAQKKYNKNTPNKLYKNYVVKTTNMDESFLDKKDFIQSQKRESRIQQQLPDSPKIIDENYISHFADREENNILMEKSGISFEKILHEKEEDPKLKKIILKQIIDQVAKMHAKGIVHCDLKPDNILVNPDGKAQLIDFGVSQQQKVKNVNQNAFKSGGYTLLYLAPERATQESFSVQSDIWSLGMILFRNLTNTSPILYNIESVDLKKDKLDLLLRYVKSGGILKHGDKNAQQLLGRMLSLDPKQRPTAQEILNHPYFAIPDDVNQASFLELQTEHQRLFNNLVNLEQEKLDLEKEKTQFTLFRGISLKNKMWSVDKRIRVTELHLKSLKQKIKLKSLLINQQKIMAKQQEELKNTDSLKKKVDENYNVFEIQLNELKQEIRDLTRLIKETKLDIRLANNEVEKLGM